MCDTNLNTCAFFFQGMSLLLKGVPFAQAEWELPLECAKVFPAADVFNACGISYVSVSADVALPEGWQAIAVRQTLALLSDDLQTARMLRAFHVAQWRRESVFCGSCGNRNVDAPGELARFCTSCGRMEYPRIAPAVITLITNNQGEVLLAHNKKFSPGVYSLISGFVEAGETLEAAVVRETREEVNIELCQIRYISSQPWPFPNSLMVGFSASYAGGVLKPDNVEIEDARWFNRNNLPQLPGVGSLSRRLIENFFN